MLIYADDIKSLFENDKNAVFEKGNWDKSERGSWKFESEGMYYQINLNSTISHKQSGKSRLRVASGTKHGIILSIFSRRKNDTNIGGGSIKELFYRAIVGSDQASKKRILKAKNDVIKYVKDRFGIEATESDFM